MKLDSYRSSPQGYHLLCVHPHSKAAFFYGTSHTFGHCCPPDLLTASPRPSGERDRVRGIRRDPVQNPIPGPTGCCRRNLQPATDRLRSRYHRQRYTSVSVLRSCPALSCIGSLAYFIAPHPGPLPSRGEGVVSACLHFIIKPCSRSR